MVLNDGIHSLLIVPLLPQKVNLFLDSVVGLLIKLQLASVNSQVLEVLLLLILAFGTSLFKFTMDIPRCLDNSNDWLSDQIESTDDGLRYQASEAFADTDRSTSEAPLLSSLVWFVYDSCHTYADVLEG